MEPSIDVDESVVPVDQWKAMIKVSTKILAKTRLKTMMQMVARGGG